MATQILQRGAAHRQLLAKGSHVARKEGHRAGLAPRYQPSDPRASEEPTAAAHPPPPPPPEEGLWACLLPGPQRPRDVSICQHFGMKYKRWNSGCVPPYQVLLPDK